VKEARKSDKGFEVLISKIEPVFIVVAGHLGGDINELVQVARIKVWRKLPKVKLSKPETIKGFLLVAGVNAMKDTVRYEGRKKTISYDDVDETMLAYDKASDIEFKGLLLQYKKYIRRNGTFQGAHREMAKRKGVSVWSIRREFHQAAKVFLEDLKR
jgi:DNA-directed RNA polymerase specialized sigma24 family protein